MIIEKVDVYVVKLDQHYRLRGVDESPGRFGETDYYIEPMWRQAYSRKVESCLVKLTTESGLTGWGESQAPLLPETPATVLTNLVGPFLLGKNALRREWIYDQIYHMMNVRGHGGGFMVDALAGVDIALWDLAGKHYGAPVCELLGGPVATELPAYVSGLRQPTLEARCEAARRVVDEGYSGIKLFLGHGVEEDAHTLREIRGAVGPGVRLLCDVLWRYRLDEALRVGRVLDSEGYACLEAPLAPEDLPGHQKLVQSLDVPIAVGEPLRTAYEFLPWISQRALEIAQPDVMRTGLTGAHKVAVLCEAHRIPVAPHVGVCTPVGMAATWQFAAAIPNFWVQEHQLALANGAEEVLDTPLEVRGGKLMVPLRPGLGVSVNQSTVEDLTTHHHRVGV